MHNKKLSYENAQLANRVGIWGYTIEHFPSEAEYKHNNMLPSYLAYNQDKLRNTKDIIISVLPATDSKTYYVSFHSMNVGVIGSISAGYPSYYDALEAGIVIRLKKME
jgi:hypothetical protein